MTEPAFRLHRHVSLVDTDDGAVLLDEKSGRYWQLNGTAYLVVCTLLDGGGVGGAVRALVSEFGVSDARAVDDVDALVRQLGSAKLVGLA